MNPTKYKNNIRTVSGNVTPYPDDVVLNVDSTKGMCTIYLNNYVQNYWSTTWRLYINDVGGMARTNNIIIVAPTGYSINASSYVLINTNGAGGLCIIGDNNNFIWTDTNGNRDVYDSGWTELLGFAFINDTSIRPQYRIVNKSMYFRNNWIIPIVGTVPANPSHYFQEPGGYYSYDIYENSAPYVNSNTPYQGVVLNDSGKILFNKGNPSLINSSHAPDSDYVSEVTIGSRRLRNYGDAIITTFLYYTSVAQIGITADGVLFINTLSYLERGPLAGWNGLGTSNLRRLNSQPLNGIAAVAQMNVNSDYFDPEDYIVDALGNVATQISNPTTAALQLRNYNVKIQPSAGNVYHALSIDAGNPYQVGGFQYNSNCLNAYLSKNSNPHS